MSYADAPYLFKWVTGWGSLPEGLELGDVPAVGVDSQDRVFVFTRAQKPVIVLDREGSVLAAWGEGLFARPHGIYVAPDDTLWCVDDFGQRVLHLTPEGDVLQRIEAPDQSAVTCYRPGYPHSVVRSSPPFCYPTSACLSAGEDRVWVSDGYGNARIHEFSIDGSLLASWGDPGTELRQFVIPHGVLADHEGRLFVSDRENERVQILDERGSVLAVWSGVHCPNNVVAYGGVYALAELGRTVQGTGADMVVVPDAMRARITICDSEGSVLAEMRLPGSASDTVWFAPHGIAVDSRGDIYVGEVTTAYSQGHAPKLPTLHKLVRLS